MHSAVRPRTNTNPIELPAPTDTTIPLHHRLEPTARNPPLPRGKSGALAWFASQLRTGRIPPFQAWPVHQWRSHPASILTACEQQFGDTAALAVRSDAGAEDSPWNSRAGEFLSLLNVAPSQRGTSIDTVANSLPGHPDDRVMVQAMVSFILFAGVASTHRVADGAPWYCLDIAPHDSAAVTSGRASGRQLAVAREEALAADGMRALSPPETLALALLQEVERLANAQPLEIEFAITRDAGRLQAWLLQARPITLAGRWPSAAHPTLCRLPSLDFLNAPDPIPGMMGQRTLLSLMSDWNPAELLGAHPRPLALSLFNRLIGHGIWWQARAELGYAKPHDPLIPLLRPLHGRPLVDVRRSANSMLPRALPVQTGQRLVDLWIDQLDAQPELHDKVEFQVYRTVRDFCPAKVMARHWSPLLGAAAWEHWESALGALTRNMTAIGPGSSLARYLGAIGRLEDESVQGGDWAGLLAACQRGTLAFAALARIAFAAEAQLRSAIALNALSPERATALRAAGRSSPVRSGSGADAASFIARHGHLRPGTFDITQRTWAASAYRPPLARSAPAPPAFELRGAERRDLQTLLHEAGLTLDADAWVRFVQQSASGREWGKFVFSRHLSAAMDCILAMLGRSGLDSDCASWLTVEQLIQGQDLPAARQARYWHAMAHAAQLQHRAEGMLIISPILRGHADRVVADSLGVLPNFVGQNVATGPVVVLEQAQAGAPAPLRDAIVVLRQADPGFDWLFDFGIAGLITAWGGANSHMAIRCAEFGLSAAIGCGEAVYARATQALHARVDPAGRALWLT